MRLMEKDSLNDARWHLMWCRARIEMEMHPTPQRFTQLLDELEDAVRQVVKAEQEALQM